jgi:hypothetical protein
MSDPLPPAESATEIVDPRVPPTATGIQSLAKRSIADRFMDLVEKDDPQSVGELYDAKESYARGIALIITWTFAVSTILILVGLYLVLRNHAGSAEDLVGKAGIPALKEAGSFLSGVFGPLLAFVLGYYFGERKSKDRS